MKNFKDIEISAVDFDDRNTDCENTNKFLVVDYNNNIYECNIKIEQKKDNYNIKEKIEKITTFNFYDWEYEEEDNFITGENKNNERITDIKYFRATKSNLDKNEDAFYIIAVTENRFYQFRGPGLTGFKQLFGRYNNDPLLFNDSCKFFPKIYNLKGNTKKNYLNILYRNEQRSTGEKNSNYTEVFSQFGWKTDTGYCFGNFEYDNSLFTTGLPKDQTKFTVMPFSKITRQGEKICGEQPIDIIHTNNHIFFLYQDCFTVISKLTSYIIHTQYFQKQYKQLIYNEFSQNNGIIFIASQKELFQISLKDENKDIWKDYLDIGDYNKAQYYCPSNKLKQRIYRIEADYEFDEQKNGFNAANKYVNSNEKFEIICLKYLMKNDLDGLKIYLQLYMTSNLHNKEKEAEDNKKKEGVNNINEEKSDKMDNKLDDKNDDKKDNNNRDDKFQKKLIISWIIEIILNQLKSANDNSNMLEFKQIIRENREYLDSDLIYELLINYGRMAHYVEFSELIGDYEKSILYHIFHKEIEKALEVIEYSLSFFSDNETIKSLSELFSNYSYIFFKENPQKSISIIQKNLKDVKMELIVHAIAKITNNENNKDINKLHYKAIIDYLKFLIDKPKVEQENNIHNLYIYYLSRSEAYHNALIEYLKYQFKGEESGSRIYYNKKKGVLFNLDYAKKLFEKKPPEYSLILALMGKYLEAVNAALSDHSEECQTIAKFIASNAPGDALKKKLWINIFSFNSQNEFKQVLNILKESKVLKIEDVLPYITDNITIEKFKSQISGCIMEYEKNINKLKENINNYNLDAEKIKVDINKIKRKPMEINNNNCKCDICRKTIEDKKLLLFPCGHMFDIYCVKKCLLDYEVTGLDYLHDKNIEIDDLFFKLRYIKEKIFLEKNMLKPEEKEKENNSKKKGKEEDKPLLQRVRNIQDINSLKKKLFRLLCEQCILCGDFMIDSVQYSLDQKDVFKADKKGLILQIQREPDFNF